jgi:hypothetical protein
VKAAILRVRQRDDLVIVDIDGRFKVLNVNKRVNARPPKDGASAVGAASASAEPQFIRGSEYFLG